MLNKVYDAALVTAGVVGLSMASKKLLGEKLTDATTLKDTANLTVGVTACTMLVKIISIYQLIPLISSKYMLLYTDNNG